MEEQLYLQAISNGRKVSLSYFKILALGPGQIGKSTFLYRLLGLMKGNIITASPETLPSCSTGQADLREVCIRFINMTGLVTNCENWESCELQSQVEGLMRLLPEQVQNELSEPPGHINASSGIHIAASQSISESDEELEKLLQIKSLGTRADPKTPFIQQNVIPSKRDKSSGHSVASDANKTQVYSDVPTPTIPRTPAPKVLSNLVDETLNDYHKLRTKCKHSPNVTKLHMLFNIADVGGQPAFLDMLPSLTIGPALYLLFSKLVNDEDQVLSIDDLTTQQLVKYRTRSDERPQDCLGYTYTLHEVLFSALSSIACFGLSDKEVEKYVTKESDTERTSSLAVLLGTFADKIGDKQAELEKTESALKALLEQTNFCQQNLITFPNPLNNEFHESQVFFRVNNHTGSEQEIAKYRQLIQDLFEKKFRKYDIPTSWLALGICMKILATNKETYKVGFDDCVEIGKHFKMNKEMVKVALNFLHKYIGLIMYFPNDYHLKDLVICNPQVVFSSVSELTFNIYDSTSRKEQHVEISSQQKKFEQTGIFSLDTVNYVCHEESNKFLSLSDLVHLLVHLNIAAEITTLPHDNSQDPSAPISLPALKGSLNKEYFLPSILKEAEISSLFASSIGLNDELLPEPLCIRFQTGYLPMGFVCALAARLMAEKKFILLTNELVLYKNKFKFRFDGRFNITMISLPLRCEFHVTRHYGSEEFYHDDCCPEIRRIICKAANSVLKSMQKTLLSENHFNLAFKCPLSIRHKDVKFGHEPLAKFIYTHESTQNQLKQIKCFDCETVLRISDINPNMKVWFGEVSA